ncbi:MAG: hypothetical protein K2R98_04315 [Gemmataceae bacterium]|nr:hypothetical protein [Gemmataceae bacterium]
MKYARGLIAVLIALGWASESYAQIPIGPIPGGLTIGRSVGFTFSSRRITGSIYFGGYGPGPGPYFYGPPLPFGPPPISSVSVILPPVQPIVMPPPRFANNPPPVAVPPQGEMDLVDPIVIRPRRPGQERLPEVPPDDAPLPGAPAGNFRPVRPEDRARAQQPMQPEQAQPPQQRPAAQALRPLQPPAKELKPKEEVMRQIAQGRLAFAAQEYGRAGGRFQEATRALPDEPLPWFLLGQAYFAVGKYREAVVAIHEGLRRDAKWPTSDFKPAELYGPNVGDYADHMLQIREALARHPPDPVLLFLHAYQLWFDGRQDDARPLFRQALPLVADPRFIQLFLDAVAGVRVVVR